MSDPALFEMRDLTIETVRDGHRRRIVEGMSLSVRNGEIYGLVGESGSGKSISMMASVGLAAASLDITAGDVSFAGRRFAASDRRGLRSNLSHGVSLLFQNAKGALSPFLTAGAQVERVLAGRLPKAARRREAIELFRVCGLNHADLADKYPHQISGGQAQRVAMACALATEPRLLIADEPTTALDVTTERELLRFLTRLCRERDLAIVLIAHNLSLVAEYCSGLTILHAGQIVERGPLASVFAEPLHPYTRGLIAAVPDVDAPHELEPLAGGVWGGRNDIERCRFSHRCPFVRPDCEAGVPALLPRAGHEVRCILYREDAA